MTQKHDSVWKFSGPGLTGRPVVEGIGLNMSMLGGIAPNHIKISKSIKKGHSTMDHQLRGKPTVSYACLKVLHASLGGWSAGVAWSVCSLSVPKITTGELSGTGGLKRYAPCTQRNPASSYHHRRNQALQLYALAASASLANGGNWSDLVINLEKTCGRFGCYLGGA